MDTLKKFGMALALGLGAYLVYLDVTAEQKAVEIAAPGY